MKKQCKDCGYLNTAKKQMVGKAYRYGCGLRPEGYILTWINTDRLLDQVSCNPPVSDDEEDEQDSDNLTGQMSIFDYPEVIPDNNI